MPTIGPTGQRLSYDQLKQLWISNGGNPTAAPIMAAIALAESGGLTNNLNDTPKTRDYSVGLWQINYFGSLAPGRTSSYGSPEALAADPNRQAKAAISLSGNGTNLRPWSAYTSGAAGQILAGKEQGLGGLPATPATPALPNYGAAAAAGGTSADNEGLLFKFHVTGTNVDVQMARSSVRKVAGATLVALGGVVGLAGVFVLVGSRLPLPGAIGAAQGALANRKGRSADKAGARAETSIAEQAQVPDELAARRAVRAKDKREREAESSFTSARSEGEAAAEAAGPF